MPKGDPRGGGAPPGRAPRARPDRPAIAISTATPSPITSHPPQVEFTNRFVQPPSEFYVFRDDLLFVRSQANSTARALRIRVRLLTPKGEVVTLDFPHVTSSTLRSPKLESFVIAEGFLLGVAVVPVILTGRRGETFVTAGITRGGTLESAITQILFSGYIEAARGPSWPKAPLESSTEGAGRLTGAAGSNPAAGVEISHTVPAFVRWRIISMAFDLVTDSTVVNRLPKIEVLVATVRTVLTPADAVQLASTTISYTVGHFGGRGSALGGAMLIPLPEHLILQEDDIIRTVTDNLQAGDDYAAPRLYVEEWLQEF